MEPMLLIAAGITALILMAAAVGIEIYRPRKEESCNEFDSFFKD